MMYRKVLFCDSEEEPFAEEKEPASLKRIVVVNNEDYDERKMAKELDYRILNFHTLLENDLIYRGIRRHLKRRDEAVLSRVCRVALEQFCANTRTLSLNGQRAKCDFILNKYFRVHSLRIKNTMTISPQLRCLEYLTELYLKNIGSAHFNGLPETLLKIEIIDCPNMKIDNFPSRLEYIWIRGDAHSSVGNAFSRCHSLWFVSISWSETLIEDILSSRLNLPKNVRRMFTLSNIDPYLSFCGENFFMENPRLEYMYLQAPSSSIVISFSGNSYALCCQLTGKRCDNCHRTSLHECEHATAENKKKVSCVGEIFLGLNPQLKEIKFNRFLNLIPLSCSFITMYNVSPNYCHYFSRFPNLVKLELNP